MLESLDCDSFCLFDHFCTLFPDTTSRAFLDVAGSFSMFYTLHCRLVPCLGSVLGDLLGKEEGREMIGQGTFLRSTHG